MTNTIFIIEKKEDFDFLKSLLIPCEYTKNILNSKSSLQQLSTIDNIIILEETSEFKNIHRNMLTNRLLELLELDFYSKSLRFVTTTKTSLYNSLIYDYGTATESSFSLLLDSFNYKFKDLHAKNTLNQDINGCYIIINDKYNKCFNRINLSNFNILDASNIEIIDLGGNHAPKLEVTLLDVSNTKTIKLQLSADVLFKKDDFNSLLASKSNTIDYFGSPKYLIYLKRYITNIADKKNFASIITHQNGLVNLNNKLYYVTSNGSMDSNGTIINTITSENPTIQYSDPKLFECQDINSNELSKVLPHLFNYADKDSIVTLILWAAANIYKYRYQQLNICICDLFIFSLSGSGKDEAVNNIISPIYNLEKNKRINLGTGSATKTTVLLAPCYNTFTPIVYNEYGNASFEIASTLIDLCKSRYDYNSETRSNIKFEINTFPNYNSPVIVLGETGFDSNQQSKALKDRHIIVSLSQNSWTSSTKSSYEIIKNSDKVLNSLGKRLLIKVMNTDNNEILHIREEIKESINSKFPEIKNRMENSLIALLHGYKLLENVCKDYNINLFEYLSYDDALKHTTSNIYKNNLNDCETNPNHIDRSIDELLNYLHRQSKSERPWRFYDDFFCVPVICYQDSLRTAKNVTMLDKDQFNKYIKQHIYVKTFKNGKTENYHARAIIIPGYNNDKPVTCYWFIISRIQSLDSFTAIRELS